MPADQLTRAEPLHTAVMDALLTSVEAAARRHRIDATALCDAVDTFVTTGSAALTGSDTGRWTQVNVSFPDDTLPAAFALALDRLGDRDAHRGWWFLHKPPGWRVRLRDVDHDVLIGTLDQLHANGVITGWTTSVYEPGTTAFGGSSAAAVVHDLFCADTRGIIGHRLSTTAFGTKEISVITLAALARGARLDSFETGDVFAKVAALRPPVPEDRADDVRRLAAALRPHLLVLPDTASLARTGGTYLEPWVDAFHDAGSRLAGLTSRGELRRGLRSVLAQVVIFHWNRLGLTATTQAVIASAAVHALIPGDE